MEMIKLKCEECGKEFTRKAWQHTASMKRSNGKAKIYCSRECAGLAMFKKTSKNKEAKKEAKLKANSLRRRPNNLIPNREVCPNCNQREIYIIDTSKNKLGHRYRRKECYNCNHRFTTYEISIEEYESRFEFKLKDKTKTKINNCYLCIHNDQEKDRCGYEIPEYKTAYSSDCFYFKKEES